MAATYGWQIFACSTARMLHTHHCPVRNPSVAICPTVSAQLTLPNTFSLSLAQLEASISTLIKSFRVPFLVFLMTHVKRGHLVFASLYTHYPSSLAYRRPRGLHQVAL